MKKNSIYDYDVDVNKDDKIISVATCTRFFGLDDYKDFRIGQKIEVKSKPKDYQINDLTFMVGGYLLHIRQGDGKGGGATWSTTFKIRPVATSYAEGGE